MMIRAPRASDPDQFVEFILEDRGDVVPALDKDGYRFAAYTTYAVVDGKEYFFQVPKATMEDDSAMGRMTHDIAMLLALDIDLRDMNRVTMTS